ncbi:GerMN domain-containing protein [Actinoplanes sp. NPDC049265]|uniref:GerMN domain-containing protein n=1 Tax=Actinoplanes sp. NPDC049265 TaxID=3363902 RepID=UPI00370FBA2C
MRRAVAAVALAVAAALTGCGVAAQDAPHAVELPRRALTTSDPVSTSAARPGEVAEVLCLVRDGSLVEVVRRIAGTPRPQEQLDHLLAGPADAERNAGLSTATTGMTLTVSFPSTPGAAEVEVTEANEDTARSDETLPYGQVVCTLTSRLDVVSVLFTKGGETLEVPRADGSLSRGPLFGSDYAGLVVPR